VSVPVLPVSFAQIVEVLPFYCNRSSPPKPSASPGGSLNETLANTIPARDLGDTSPPIAAPPLFVDGVSRKRPVEEEALPDAKKLKDGSSAALKKATKPYVENTPKPRSVKFKPSPNPNAAFRIGELVWISALVEPGGSTQARIQVPGFEDTPVDIDRLRHDFVRWPALVLSLF
jgi:hypothetical protein